MESVAGSSFWHRSRMHSQPALTLIGRGFASSRRGTVNFGTPSFRLASTRDVSESSLTAKCREKVWRAYLRVREMHVLQASAPLTRLQS
jgi:hypothetical protein